MKGQGETEEMQKPKHGLCMMVEATVEMSDAPSG
jgi:hypothetical protein